MHCINLQNTEIDVCSNGKDDYQPTESYCKHHLLFPKRVSLLSNEAIVLKNLSIGAGKGLLLHSEIPDEIKQCLTGQIIYHCFVS